MSEELREKIDMELATDGDAAVSADCDADSDILVVEYVSDDETVATADKVKPDDEHDDESDYVLKVIGDISVYYSHFWIIIDSDRRPETKQGIEGKIDSFRSGRVRVRDRVRVRYN